MLDILYDIFIFPLVVGMNYILVNAYELTSSYGLAIIILSFVVNIALLPLYNIADKWQKDEREKQVKMEAKVAEIKLAFKGQERFMMLKTLYRQSNYHPVMAVRNSIGFLIQVPFFFAAYQLLSNFPEFSGQSFGPFKDLGFPDGLVSFDSWQINIMPFVMTAINLVSSFVYTKDLQTKDKIQLSIFSVLFLVLLYSSPVGLVLYWTLNNVFSLMKNIVSRLILNKNHKSNDHEVCLIYRALDYVIPNVEGKRAWYISTFTMFVLIFMYPSVSLFTSDVSVFKFSNVELAEYLIVLLSWFLITSFYISLLVSNNMSKKVNFVLIFLSLISIVYVLIPLVDFGHIDGYMISNVAGLGNRKVTVYYDLTIYVLLYVSLLLFVRFLKVNNVLYALMIISGVISLSSLYNLFFLNNERKEVVVQTNYSKEIPHYNAEISTYSKTGKNIVVLMLDMFTGDHVEKIFAEYPKLKESFSGFVNYPDTLSVGNYTYSGVSSIHGGHLLTPRNLNLYDSEQTLAARSTTALNNLITSFGKSDFDVSIAGMQFADCDELLRKNQNSYLKHCADLTFQYDYLNTFSKEHGIKLDYSVDQFRFLRSYGIFSVSPYVFKKYVYGDSSWLGALSKRFIIDNITKYSYVSLMHKVSHTTPDKSYFKYFGIDATHGVYSIDKNLELTEDVVGWNENKDESGVFPAHYYAEVYTLEKISLWLEWMKKNEIFDNTMVVLVSDHSAGDSIGLNKSFPKFMNGHFDLGQKDTIRQNALLMIKDFNSNKDFETSNELMSNADVAGIVCAQIGGCDGIPDVDPRGSTYDRVRTTDITTGRDDRNYYKFSIEKSYDVKGSMFILDNWKQVK